MHEKNLSIETDDNLNAYLVVQCSSCGHNHRKMFETLPPMLMVTCHCGSLLPISSEDIRKAARRVEALKRLIGKLEKLKTNTDKYFP